MTDRARTVIDGSGNAPLCGVVFSRTGLAAARFFSLGFGARAADDAGFEDAGAGVMTGAGVATGDDAGADEGAGAGCAEAIDETQDSRTESAKGTAQ